MNLPKFPSAKRFPFLGAAAFCALALSGCAPAPEVEAVSPRREAIEESFSETARTRLATDYRVALPVDGRVERIELEPGDPVSRGQALARYDLVPLEQAAEEARGAVQELRARLAVADDHRLEESSLEQAEAAVRATRQTLQASDKQVEAQLAVAERRATEFARLDALHREGVESSERRDEARLEADTSQIRLREIEFNRASLEAIATAVEIVPRIVHEYLERKSLEREVLVAELAQAQARLALAEHRLALAREGLKSPVDGVVLERLDKGGRQLPAGSAVLTVGSLKELEAVADVLTQDALRLSEGDEVELRPAARLPAFRGEIRRVEPQGFTKVSSLGVEQQRVNVIIAILSPPEGLGAGYQLEARFVTGREESALIVPRASILQSPEGGHYALRIGPGGRLENAPAEVGLRGDASLQIVSGLGEKDRIVASPRTTLREGTKVQVR